MPASPLLGRARRIAATAAATIVLVLGLSAGPPVLASTPPSGSIAAPDAGTKQLAYTGTVPPGTGSPSNQCVDGVNADRFTLHLTGFDAAYYQAHKALLTLHIEWDPQFDPDAGGSDLALVVQQAGDTVGTSDGGTNEETVNVDKPAGTYQVFACAFANAAPQDYKGTVTLSAGHLTPLPLASPSRGLTFMPLVVADPQRNLGEPTLRVDRDGVIYHCGPFGSSRNADYASRSTDGGDTFRTLGTPPEGRIAPGGGGDCDLSIAPERNDQGHFTVSYAGLESLTNFSTGVSEDTGRSWQGTVTSETIPVVDRQWLESNGKQEVYLFYNQIPDGGTVQRSTDGGLTYTPADPGNAAPSITRPGNIVLDRNSAHNFEGKNNETVFVAYTNGNRVQVSRSADQGQTFHQIVVARTLGAPDNLFPSLDIDRSGNLYVAWVEAGTYNVYYAFSKDHGATWSSKQLVNRKGAATNLMPWMAAGTPGRIAVGFYCSPVDGNPQTGEFHGPWNVCVNESFDALSPHAHFSQVHVAHHPTHWDSICTSGLGCDTSVPAGDRSLLDFFEIRIDPRDGRVMALFTDANKYPRADTGLIGIDMFAKQKAGPSLLAPVGNVEPDPRPVVRNTSYDRIGDAKFPISSFGPPPTPVEVPGLDIQWVKLSKTTLPGKPNALQVQMKVRNLSDDALASALAQLQSQQLKFVVRWKSGYRPDFVVANWRPGQGFEFLRGHLFEDRTQDGALELYTGEKDTVGVVDQAHGLITWKVPYAFMQAYELKPDLTATPDLHPAHPGDPIWEVAGWTFGRPNPQPAVLDYYNQADSTASFDYRLP